MLFWTNFTPINIPNSQLKEQPIYNVAIFVGFGLKTSAQHNIVSTFKGTKVNSKMSRMDGIGRLSWFDKADFLGKTFCKWRGTNDETLSITSILFRRGKKKWIFGHRQTLTRYVWHIIFFSLPWLQVFKGPLPELWIQFKIDKKLEQSLLLLHSEISGEFA